MIEGAGDAIADVTESAGKGFFAIFKALLGPLGAYAMTILYVICGIICLIILYKLYKKYQESRG